MPHVRTVEPIAEPLTVAEAQDFLRVSTPDEAVLVGGLISAARDLIERFTGRAMLLQTWKLQLESWTCPSRRHHGDGAAFIGLACEPWRSSRGETRSIELPRSPVIAVSSVQYYDANNTLQTLDPVNYVVDSVSTPGRIVLADGASWPGAYNRPDAIQITFTAGYGSTAAQVPASLIHAVRFAVSHFYDMRQPIVIERATVDELPFTLRHLLESWRVDFVA